MTNRMRALYLVLGLGATIGSMLTVAACNSSAKYTRESSGTLQGGFCSMSQGARTPAEAPAPPNTHWSAAATRSADDFLIPHHDRVPQIDLNNVLVNGDGDGGAAGSPSKVAPFWKQDPKKFVLSVYDENEALLRQRAKNGGTNLAAPPVVQVPTPPGMEVSLIPGQELLVIERTARPDRYSRPANDDHPGSGTLMTRWCDAPGQPEREVPVPLQHTNVQATITGPISSVNVTQQFHNPYSSKIEAVYVFPLPDDAAVNDFVMTIGSRSVRGVIREREQAQQIYNQAKAQGYHASLMSQERANIFTQRVANIEPNERIDISITYFGTLGFREGGYEFIFPMVVGPRYNPASTYSKETPGTGVGALPAYAPPSGQATNVSYLRPEQRCGRDISVSVNLNAGVPIEAIDSPTHHIGVQTSAGAATATINLNPSDTIPNRDFVLRYRVAGGQVRAGMIATRDEGSSNPDDNFFTMVLVPPADLSYFPRGPVEMVFVIDCSGSMSGPSLELAKRCVRNALPALRSADTLQIIRFSDKAVFMTRSPVNANPENIGQADQWVANLQSSGGTELLNGLEPALELRGDWKRTRFVCILSDGLLGNEPEVLGQLKRKLGDSRIFTVSIGSAPNRALMNSMARMGRGCAATVSVPPDADDVMRLFMQRVSAAAMADLRLEFGSLDEKDVYPKKLPDLFVDRPVVITGKFRGQPRPGQTVKVTGRIGENRQTLEVPIQWSDPAQSKALPLVWARARITELDEESSWGRKAGAGSTQGPNRGEIKDLALRYNLMSAYTSFVAVDCNGRTQGNYGTTVAVPSPMPPGTRYETTVPSR